jgi:hypothetical protein
MRRALWGPLLIVVGLLVGASLYARRDQLDLMPVRVALAAAADRAARTVVHARPVVTALTERITARPLPWAAAGGGMLLLALGALAWRRRHRTRAAGASGTAPVPRFEDALDAALIPGGADGRRHRVELLARDGRSVGQIARATRLSQDAVRTVLDAH